jgi:hypothetical protein
VSHVLRVGLRTNTYNVLTEKSHGYITFERLRHDDEVEVREISFENVNFKDAVQNSTDVTTDYYDGTSIGRSQ